MQTLLTFWDFFNQNLDLFVLGSFLVGITFLAAIRNLEYKWVKTVYVIITVVLVTLFIYGFVQNVLRSSDRHQKEQENIAQQEQIIKDRERTIDSLKLQNDSLKLVSGKHRIYVDSIKVIIEQQKKQSNHIKQQYNEKINSIDRFTNDDIDGFFADYRHLYFNQHVGF